MDKKLPAPEDLPERTSRSHNPGRRSSITRLSRESSSSAVEDGPPSYEQVQKETLNSVPLETSPEKEAKLSDDEKKQVAFRKVLSDYKKTILDSREESDPLSEDETRDVDGRRGIKLTEELFLNDPDPLNFLKYYDTVFIIDDSGSMVEPDGTNGLTRWEETKLAIAAMVPDCVKRDEDGIDIYFLNDRDKDQKQIKSATEVMGIFDGFKPKGLTPLGAKLGLILEIYLDEYQKKHLFVKPVNFIVITDGEPSTLCLEIIRQNPNTPGQDHVKLSIAKAIVRLQHIRTKTPKQTQIGIQFFQVGQDPGAKEFLANVDNKLCTFMGISEEWDIVDTCTFDKESGGRPIITKEGIYKVLLGAINKRMDLMKERRRGGARG